MSPSDRTRGLRSRLDRLEIFTDQERLLFAREVEVEELESEFLF